MNVPVHGEPPDLVGSVLEGVRLQSFVCDGVLVQGASVVFLKVAGCWHRLAIDHGTVHWRREENEPSTWSAQEGVWEYPVRELADAKELLGIPISSLATTGIDDVASVELLLENGRRLRFAGKGDENALDAV
jgi:hypothetical protein